MDNTDSATGGQALRGEIVLVLVKMTSLRKDVIFFGINRFTGINSIAVFYNMNLIK